MRETFSGFLNACSYLFFFLEGGIKGMAVQLQACPGTKLALSVGDREKRLVNNFSMGKQENL
jgi:hypothetical protein